jgi:uncharacterized membrane protein YccF (DUF307 family)
MRTIANVLWLVLGGIEMAILYVLAGVIAAVLIVTIPLVVPAFRLAGYTLWPFGRVVVRQHDAGAGSAIGNLVWFLLVGWLLALGHLVFALLNAVTIIGIPFAVAHLKLAGLALRPYGKDVVDRRFAHQHEVVLGAPALPAGAQA